MYRNLFKQTTIALGTLLISSSLVMAGGLQGSVTALDGKGMGTVRTSDGKDHQVKVGPEFKVGSKVDCEMKNQAMECRLGAAQSSAVQPVPSPTTPGTMAKPAAQPAVSPTAQAPAHPAPTQPSPVSPAPAQTSSAIPQSATPAPATK
ncbi:MAG: hypothetical protein AB7N91_18895 [Candidatus Tectimicrobiota bacterium]